MSKSKTPTRKVRFGEPPAPKNTPPLVDWEPTAAQLRARPGEWAKVYTHDSTPRAGALAQTIRGGRANAWKPVGAFEARARGLDVWARYVDGSKP